MGALFGGDSPAPTVAPPPPPPPPPVIEDTAAVAQESKRRLLNRKGAEATLLTGADGAADPAVKTKTLLGE